MVHWQIMQLCMCSPIMVGARSGLGVTSLPIHTLNTSPQRVGYANDCAAIQYKPHPEVMAIVVFAVKQCSSCIAEWEEQVTKHERSKLSLFENELCVLC